MSSLAVGTPDPRFGVTANAVTLVDLLEWRAQSQAERVAYTFLGEGETERISLSWAELQLKAQLIGQRLTSMDAAGKTVLLLYPSDLEYVAAFFGCLYAGAIAVPAYPPRLNRNLHRLQAVVADSQATLALSVSFIRERIEPLCRQFPLLNSLRWLATDSLGDDLKEDDGDEWRHPVLSGDTPAFLQYTSGSTSAHVPLDPRNPQQRIDDVLSNAKASILLTDLNEAGSERTDNPQIEIAAENLAYIIYTSGSTGQPKGVMVQHRSVVNLAAALREEVYAGLGESLKVGLSAPLAFDASVKQIVQLLHGHTLHLLPEELRLDAVGALQYLDQHQLDVLDCTPSQLKLLLAAGFSEHSTPQLMLVGGEALDEATWSRLAADEQTRFFNVYGPTECTVDTTWAQVTGALPIIGRPIPNAETYILDNLEPSGIHLAGELHIGGIGLARGYLDAPDKTAERFVPDGLSGNVGARLYRTGDLARQFADGTISFIGRNDSQVKVRGHRIELGEIESALRQDEKVRQAVVIARESNNAREGSDVRLVGYLVAEGRQKLDVAELRRKLSERLPDYMLPSFLVVIDELPLTRNGKVDLNALPAPEAIRAMQDEHYVAPRNEIEATITRIWQEALGVERIGVNDNFFDAGGHSLLMVQVHNKLTELFDKKISIVEMFAKPTISSLAEYFSETNGHKPTFDKAMDRAARRRQAATMRQ